MQDARTILPVIEQLYAAAASQEAWTPALASVVSLFRAGHATFSISGNDGIASSFAACAGLDERDQALLSSPEALRLFAPWGATAPVNTAFSSSQLWPDRDFERSEFHNEIVRPTNGFYGTAALRLLPFGVLSVFICRPRSAGDFDASEIGMLQALLPHLATAAELHHRLRAAMDGHDSLIRLIDRLDSGVILADATGAPVFANAQALRIAAEADGLMLNGALAGATAESTRCLRDAVAHVAVDAATEPLRIALGRPSRRPALQLMLLPIWRLGIVVPSVRTPRVAILITAPDAPVAIDRLAVADTFHLTRRESEVAVLLAEGRDLANIGRSLGVNVTAVRQYLKRVFDKTGVHNQAALVALVRGFTDRLTPKS